MSKNHKHFRLHDVSEFVVGSVLLAFPVAITEEVWNLGKELSTFSTLAIVSLSLFFLAWFATHTFYNSDLHSHRVEIFLRVISVYCVTLIVAALILGLFSQFPLLTEPAVAMKRMVIVALPASFCATVVDSLR
ncbi:MAG: DUF2391 family protein [Arenicellales bacterium]